ncbi:hypothetical protein C2M07_05825 [Serratia marcescens]|nr:hypothetical protein C2M07_05825 [Serratia marcescens]PNU49451.1 hypothetical protein C2M03_12970 [Serratia marcescens]
MSGFILTFNFNKFVLTNKKIGIPFPFLSSIFTIIIQLMGSLTIILDIYGLGWLGVCTLIIFTLLTIPLGHPFWTFTGEKREIEFNIALEHLSVIGGLIIVSLI